MPLPVLTTVSKAERALLVHVGGRCFTRPGFPMRVPRKVWGYVFDMPLGRAGQHLLRLLMYCVRQGNVCSVYAYVLCDLGIMWHL